MDGYVKPQPTWLSKTIINQLAEDVADYLHYHPGDPLEPIVEDLGGNIVYQDLDDWYESESGSIVVYDPGKFDIYISNFTSRLRDRFTIAHELGHYVLHSDYGEKVRIAEIMRIPRRETDNIKDSNRIEWEANWFAAGFLMPERCFREEYNNGANIVELSRTFQVSTSAAEYRIKYIDQHS